MATVFIDGQAGTTGLQITERLSNRADLELLYLSDTQRKDPQRRQACLQQADIAILCLPDDAARQAVELADGQGRLLDASSAHRVAQDWVYGLPELCAEQRALIGSAARVSNPGCYPQGFILLARPLIEAGMLSADTALRCHAVSGYSGGGRSMIEAHAGYSASEAEQMNSQVYALSLQHKHVPEMHVFSTTRPRPLFSPMVAHYYQGMLVQLPLFASELGQASAAEIHAVLSRRYADEPFVQVMPLALPDGNLNPTACNGSNIIQLMVLGNDEQILLVARYDNLGKGAAGVAVQNLNLMLGLDETLSL